MTKILAIDIIYRKLVEYLFSLSSYCIDLENLKLSCAVMSELERELVVANIRANFMDKFGELKS